MKELDKLTLGQKVKKIRKWTGKSQQTLANDIGVSIDTIKSIETERSNPSIETLSKLSDIFDISTDYLLGKTKDSSLPYEVMLKKYTDLKNSAKDKESEKFFDFMIEIIERDNKKLMKE